MATRTLGIHNERQQELEYNPDCTLCPKMCANTANVCMEGDGSSTSDLMIVGEALNEADDEMNLPFMGRSGELLRDELLSAAGIPESKVRFTYAVRCHPLRDKTPTVLEIKRCRKYLEAEIRRVRPKVIVAMGNVPLASLMQFFYKGEAEEGTAKKQETKVSGITRWQGKLFWLQEFGCWLLPTFTPAMCLLNELKRSTYTSSVVVKDLKRAWKVAKEDTPNFSVPDSILVSDRSRAKVVLDEMWNSGDFAFDIETGGIGRSCEKFITGASFSCSESVGYYIPWSVFTDHKPLMSSLTRLLTSKKHYKVMHNGAYEVRILQMAHGIAINGVRYFDTMIAAHLVDENFSKRLKDLAWIYTNFGGYDIPLEKYRYDNRIREDYSLIPESILYPYAALDAVATWIIYKRLDPLMEYEGVHALFDKIAMPARRVMSDAEINGMRVDLDRAFKLSDLCAKAVERIERDIYRCAGREFNIGSPKQLQEVLYRDMGFTPLKETKTGYSSDAASLEYLSTQPNSEIVQHLLDRSYVNTMTSTHIGQALAYTWPEDGRVHTNYNSTGAVTGRVSASQPSLQNVPQDRLIRSLYIASPGNKLVEADLKSAEIATVAAVSGEETFIRAFQEGLDIHSETYRKIYDLPADYECSKLERRMAKTINFGLIYGLTVVGLSQRLNITVEEGTEFMNLYFKRLPRIATWMDRQKALVKSQGYVVSVFGRKRRLPLGLSDRWGDIGRAERQAMNSPIQSGAADYTAVGLVRLRRSILTEGLRGMIVHTVHDCVITDTPEGEVPRMVESIRDAFETPIKVMPINMRVDVEVNDSWGQENESRLEEVFTKVGLKIT